MRKILIPANVVVLAEVAEADNEKIRIQALQGFERLVNKDARKLIMANMEEVQSIAKQLGWIFISADKIDDVMIFVFVKGLAIITVSCADDEILCDVDIDDKRFRGIIDDYFSDREITKDTVNKFIIDAYNDKIEI